MSKVGTIEGVRIAVFDPYLDTLGGGEKYMLSAASFLSKNHDVFLLWDDKSILERAQERFGLDFSRVHVEKNIFSSGITLSQRFTDALGFDRIFYLSDGSIPLLPPGKLVIHFQFPIEWVSGASFMTQLKIRTAKRVVCNSKFTKKYIDKKFKINSSVLYPPSHVETTLMSPKENVILSVGRLSRSSVGVFFKKQDIMIDVFKKMVDKGLKKWKLVLVISYKDADKKFLEELKKQSSGYSIEIIENCSGKELESWYSKAKIYWHAAGFNENLEKNPEKAEHFGISTVEAMAKSAVPVVINAGGQKEVVKEGENGFLWNTLEELQEDTLQVITDSNLEKKLSLQAKNDSQQFSEEKFAKHLQKLIV